MAKTKKRRDATNEGERPDDQSFEKAAEFWNRYLEQMYTDAPARLKAAFSGLRGKGIRGLPKHVPVAPWFASVVDMKIERGLRKRVALKEAAATFGVTRKGLGKTDLWWQSTAARLYSKGKKTTLPLETTEEITRSLEESARREAEGYVDLLTALSSQLSLRDREDLLNRISEAFKPSI
jgi:hypothetical protein